MDEQQYNKKKRDIDIGLANNSFGAAMGALATATPAALAVRNARAVRRGQSAAAPKPPGRVAQFKTQTAQRTRAALARNPKTAKTLKHGAWAVPAALAAGQAFNGAADAQSAAYFAREKKDLMQKKPVEKSFDNGLGTGVAVEFRKASQWREQRAKRTYEQGIATGIGGAIAAGGAGALGYNLGTMPVPAAKKGAKRPRTLAAAASRTARANPGRLIIPAAAMVGGGYVAQRSLRMARNEADQRWH